MEHRFDPWSGKIPHASGQLSPWAPTTEAWAPRVHALQQEKSQQREALAPQLEKAQEQQQTPVQTKTINTLNRKQN